MIIEQLYTGCLAEAAYYIESDGEVAIIDPLREVDQYINLAKSRNAKIKYVLETHFHADFVSGHVDLAAKTGATIVYGPTAMQTGFKAHIATDGEILNLGKVKIKVIHTPGHTMESCCFLLQNEAGLDTALFSGDTLFIGDVGRPDLAQHVIADLTQEKLAGHLYESLRNKIMPLSDDIIVYPNHGAGSACGKNMSKETTDTLGHQKKVNYALNPLLNKEEFIKDLLNGLTPPPGYFPQNVLLNIKGYENIDEVMARGNKALSAEEFETAMSEDKVVVIDSRRAPDFGNSFIPGSINIGLNGNFAVWVGTLVPDVKQRILIVADIGSEKEVLMRLSRVGYDQAIGYLEGGFDSWLQSGRPTDSIITISSEELAQINETEKPEILDVRKTSEFNSEHLMEATSIPLDYVSKNLASVNKNLTYYVHCAGGYRSMTFVSILRTLGYRNLINVDGGFAKLKASGKFKTTEYKEPISML
ncbi:MAG: MBL fold metallo-hydrolase [Bacteroidia bacterium]|nr:MBL fold metallo-hydrolase [Bacteroidia bacterium]